MDGREYYFKSRPDFEAMVATGEMLEHAEVFGNFYGSPKGPVEAAMTEGRDTLFDIDWQGGQQIRFMVALEPHGPAGDHQLPNQLHRLGDPRSPVDHVTAKDQPISCW